MKLAFISDIHEDIISLKEAMRKIEKAGCDEIICLGDISGFSAPYYNYYDSRNASECLSIIKNSCSHVILGNHDLFAIQKIPEISPNFQFPENWYELDYHQKKAISNNQVWINEIDELNPLYKKVDIVFLSSCPETEIIEKEGVKFFISHNIYPNISGFEKQFYFEYFEFVDHMNYIDQKNCNLSFSGHSHPEGIAYASDNEFILKGFKTMKLKTLPAAIICPAIAKGKNRNGFLIFDITENTLTARKI